jgi:hypothetical protein
MMFKSTRRRLNYANVTATLALVFSMSGGALAANHYLINSTKQISPKLLKKLKGKTGARGATGATGAAGAAGAQGKEGSAGKEGKEGPEGQTGPPGQARAFASIKPGTPATIKAGSRGVVSATTFSSVTCVFLDPTVEPSSVVAVVTAHLGNTTFSADAGGCFTEGKQGLQINGFNSDGSANTTQEFSLVVP